jgi:hypothetical protein
MSGRGPFWGKYRGTVLNNIDPLFRGRLQCEVIGVHSIVPAPWAQPCIPLSGPPGAPMGVHVLPLIGAGVWIEFENGDPDHPIWVGCRFDSAADVPAMAKAGLPVSPSIVLQTAGQNMIVISDLPGPAGGIMIQSGPSTVSINQTGVSIVAPKVDITATAINLLGTTDINMGALKVT